MRSPSVASMMGTLPCHYLNGLADEEALTLLLKLAFKQGEEYKYPNLVEIGKDIIKKCGGVPLAVRTLGSLLYMKTDEKDWILVKDSEIWRLEQKENQILPALKLSYSQMPSYLKHCFAAFLIFPKDYNFHSFELIQFWMAQGLLQVRHGNQAQDLEDIGKQYLYELFSRSFLEDFNDGRDFYLFKIHDLLHDLALLLAERECLHIDNQTQSISQQVQHLSFSHTDFHVQEANLQRKSTNIRNIMFAAEEEWPTNVSVLETCFSRYKYLRLLDLRYSSFEVLPSSIGYLKHLRNLSLQRNYKLRKLPNSICKLQSLQTLRLGGCEQLEELPRDIKKMVSLRFLILTTKQKILPENGIGCLRSLRFLSISKSANLETLLQGKRSLTNLQDILQYLRQTAVQYCAYWLGQVLVAFRFKMGRRIKEVTTRLDEIAADRDKFHLVEGVIDHGRSFVHVRREMTHSFVIASDVIGRSSDKEKVVFPLMYPENVQHVSVVSIVGIGGLGKTTLAKLVFNDDRVIGRFELTIWVCVSDYFDLKLLMVNIIKSVSGENCSDLDPDRLQMHLRQKLDGKKFLLVLDDVWNDDLEKWIESRNLLSAGAEGSKILATTRSVTPHTRGRAPHTYKAKPYKYARHRSTIHKNKE
ncbi:LOW QUALITY PROTEIN: NB-ARC domain, LRR domain containing protein [Trema orientale]|uniref:NB-ARC domain, LRR domain containing protein n=1 Tax=Trema orientale TaxID=63057 RepID=A0A2P5A9S9_TREOI|nr:LOW QUALITY PROTEIN: NB-ARC domain, LRR domain containing protein [Trema orientale]